METWGSWELPSGPPIAGEEPDDVRPPPPPPPTDTAAPASVPVAGEDGVAEPYESPVPLASFAQLGLVACAVVAAGAVVSDVAQYVFADALLRDPTNVNVVDRLTTSDLWQGMLAVLTVLVGVPTAAAFLMWESRVYRNLPALGARDLQVTPGWVVGAWFVPVVNVIWPKLIVDEAWRSSALESDDPIGGRTERVPIALHIWWVTLIGSVALWLMSGWMTGSVLVDTASDAGSLRLGYAIEIVASALGLAAAVLGAGLVRDLTSRQVERADRARSEGDDARRGSVQPRIDQRPVPGYPPPPAVPPVSTAPPFPRYP